MSTTQASPIFHTMTKQAPGLSARRPTIVANPSGDRAFAARIERSMSGGARHPADLEAALRPTYPAVVVRPRDISGEYLEVWYVYRDGHWVAKEVDEAS